MLWYVVGVVNKIVVLNVWMLLIRLFGDVFFSSIVEVFMFIGNSSRLLSLNVNVIGGLLMKMLFVCGCSICGG